jgi:hypothetical protein
MNPTVSHFFYLGLATLWAVLAVALFGAIGHPIVPILCAIPMWYLIYRSIAG